MASRSLHLHLMRLRPPSIQPFYAHEWVNRTSDGGVFLLANGAPTERIHSISNEVLTLTVKSSHYLFSAFFAYMTAVCSRFIFPWHRSWAEPLPSSRLSDRVAEEPCKIWLIFLGLVMLKVGYYNCWALSSSDFDLKKLTSGFCSLLPNTWLRPWSLVASSYIVMSVRFWDYWKMTIAEEVHQTGAIRPTVTNHWYQRLQSVFIALVIQIQFPLWYSVR